MWRNQLAAVLTEVSMQVKECTWTGGNKCDDEPDTWDTECGQRFSTVEGDIAENRIVYCPFCGGKILEAKP